MMVAAASAIAAVSASTVTASAIPSENAVFSGDLIHSPLQARYPEMSMKFDVDQAAAAKTRRSFLERYCDTDTLCCTAHFPSPSVGRIRRWGDGFSCEAV
jgi:glyoxylase-like metal-dependent hydrolase (beta-lactamase superfamily II)